MHRRETLAALGSILAAGCTAPGTGGRTTTDPTAGTTAESTATREPTGSATTGTSIDSGTDWTVDFSVSEIRCAAEQSGTATVAFDGSTVTIEGTILGADACYRARVDSLTYDELETELVLTVESYSDADEDTACAECLTAIDYRAVIAFTGGSPSSVVVRHRSGGSVSTVTTARR